MENAESYISTGASAHWDMLVFEHNKHQIDESKQMATEMAGQQAGFAGQRGGGIFNGDSWKGREMPHNSKTKVREYFHSL